MTDDSGTSPCFLFHHQYVGPYPDRNPSRFTVHCTLEKGAEAYYSGIRVIVIAKKIGYHDKFAKAEIRQVIWVAGKPVEIEPPEVINEVIDEHALTVNGLPFYILILELIDLSHATWTDAKIRFQAAVETSSPGPLQQIPDTHKVLYEYAKHTTSGHSSSCFLPLATRYVGLQPQMKQQNPFQYGCVSPTRTGSLPPTHRFRILPPSERRPVFTQPPSEILYHIFSILVCNGGPKGLITASLVCRAWRVALCVTYEDFEYESLWRLQTGRLATALEDTPEWGRYITRFSSYCFKNPNTSAELRGDALTILETASNMRRLIVGNVSAVLAGEFVEAFCKMTELRYFTQCLQYTPWLDDEDFQQKTYLNAAQLTKCFAHWPNLRQATVCKFGRPFAEDLNGLAITPARCALDEIKFERGLVTMAQLRAINASSQDTLHTVVLKHIRGIGNKELKSWLLDFGPNLTSLTLECNVFPRSRSVFPCFKPEELAMDATIHKMTKLLHLEIDGPVATALTLLRFGPGTAQGQIAIRNPVLINPHGFVKALRTTKWESVDVMGLRISEKLFEKANEVAKEREIHLWMW